MPKLVNDLKAINALIKSAHTTGAKFGEVLHDAGFNTVHHAINTGDVRPLQALYDGLKPAAQLALRSWAVKFGPFVFKEGKLSVKRDRSHDAASLENIAPMDYQRVSKPPVKKTFDLKAEIAKLIKRAAKYNSNGTALVLLDKAAKAA